MPRRRQDPGRCANGHELHDHNAYRTPSGKVECRACMRERVRKTRDRRRHHLPLRDEEKLREPEMTPAEVERFLAQSRAEEDLPAYLKPRRMWPDDPPARQR
jgi:hypothetical protein